MKCRIKKNKKGDISLLTTVLVCGILLSILIPLSQKIVIESKISKENLISQQAIQAAKTGLDDWKYNLVDGKIDISDSSFNKNWPNSNTLSTISRDGDWIILNNNLGTQYRVEYKPSTDGGITPASIIGKGRVKKDSLIVERAFEEKFELTNLLVNKNGSSIDKAAPSAKYLVDNGIITNGEYWIDLPIVGPTKIYCILDPKYDGGGWMMAMKATKGTTFNYDSIYWTANNILNDNSTDKSDQDAKFNTMNYFQAKDMMAIWPDIPNKGNESGSIDGLSNWTWLENNFNGGVKITPINFFNISYSSSLNSGSGKFIQDAKTFSGWSNGVFSSQKDIRFYGFNYESYPSSNYYSIQEKVRWGFGWNENGENLFTSNNIITDNKVLGSNDVSGGIGMGDRFGNYSAGDVFPELDVKLSDTQGINRKARVEVYIR